MQSHPTYDELKLTIISHLDGTLLQIAAYL